MVKFMQVIRRTSEFGSLLLQTLAFCACFFQIRMQCVRNLLNAPGILKGWESIPLYHSCQVCPDISTMIDMRDGVVDYFPLYRLFWGLFSTMLNPAKGVC